MLSGLVHVCFQCLIYFTNLCLHIPVPTINSDFSIIIFLFPKSDVYGVSSSVLALSLKLSNAGPGS